MSKTSRIIFGDRSPYEICQVPNRQNYRVRAHSSSQVPVVETVKQPLKILVWGMMSYRGLSDLHIIDSRPSRPTATSKR